MSELVQRTCQVRVNTVTGSKFFCPGACGALTSTMRHALENTERCGKAAYGSVEFNTGDPVWMCFDHYFECTGGR